MNGIHTTGPTMSVIEAWSVYGSLIESAEAARTSAVGKIHNSKLSLLDEARDLRALAERIAAWANAEQERVNHAQSSGVRALMAGRAAARAKATGSTT